jgi:hypothetical protein
VVEVRQLDLSTFQRTAALNCRIHQIITKSIISHNDEIMPWSHPHPKNVAEKSSMMKHVQYSVDSNILNQAKDLWLDRGGIQIIVNGSVFFLP